MIGSGTRLSGRRGTTFIVGFWLVVTVLLGARVAMFDEIAAVRIGPYVSASFAALATTLLR